MKSMSEFVHLHNHTEYSFLDGAIKIKDLVKRAVEYGMPALAITDHGGMFGAIEFHHACIAAGIKPVIGFEAYVAPRSRFDKTRAGDEKAANHLVLLAKDDTGYRNLLKLSSIGYTEGFYYKPRVDLEALRENAEGIIATSACIAGAIPRAIIDGKRARAKELIEEHLRIFGEGNFYLEIQRHGMEEEKVANEGLLELAAEIGVPLVAANDAHYLKQEDSVSHEILLCLQTRTVLSDPNRYRFSTDQVYFKSPDEMAKLYEDIPEALSNTVEIAQRCNVEVKVKPQLPKYDIPDGFGNEDDYLRAVAQEGLRKRYEHVTPGLQERLEYELEIITSMGFSGYFLIVQDFVRAAHEREVMVGCRGSAAGSLVAYALEITSVDPIKFDLIFERFLNPERISMPDADIDFADHDRYKIIEYVVDKYGREAVCQIINFGRMKAKMVVRDVARAMGLPVAEAGQLADMVNEKTLEKSIAANGELANAIKSNPTYQELFRHGQALEGLARQAGMHAGGVIIAPGPVTNWAPLFKQPGTGIVMTQYDMKTVEDSGLIKMDFLGLRTLTVLQEALRLIRKYHNRTIDLWSLADGDEKTYELFGRGDTTGVFQFESNGMQDYLRKLKPNTIEDIIAMAALYRPGPMANIDTYIHRKHGREQVHYLHPMLEEVLSVTNGVIIYQEQVMRIAQMMGGFTLGQADILRKAMGKKQAEKMEVMGKQFVEGAVARDVDRKVARDVYDLMAKFAEYGFNKAHATVYAHVSYQAAYLKAHYPVEFLTATLTSWMGNQDQFLVMKTEAERLGIKLLPPDVNTSERACAIEDGNIRLGLAAIKNVGKAVESLLEARSKGGRFASLFDLCSRVDLRLVNKKALESLVYAGALDSLPGTRAQHHAGMDTALDYGSSFQEERASGQTSLFGESSDEGLDIPEPSLPDVPPWPYNELLAHEKELLNFYVSGHPLDRYRDEIRGFATTSLGAEALADVRPGQKVTVGGLIVSLRPHTQKNGKQMAFGLLEDFEGTVDLVVFNDAFERIGHLLAADVMVLVHGSVDKRDGDPKPKILVDNVMPLSEAREKLARSVHIRIHTQGLEPEFVSTVTEACGTAAGECALVVHLVTRENNDFRVLSRQYKLSPAKETLARLREKLGEENVWLSKVAA